MTDNRGVAVDNLDFCKRRPSKMGEYVSEDAWSAYVNVWAYIFFNVYYFWNCYHWNFISGERSPGRKPCRVIENLNSAVLQRMKKVPRIGQDLRQVMCVIGLPAFIVGPFHSASVTYFPYRASSMRFFMGACVPFRKFEHRSKMQNNQVLRTAFRGLVEFWGISHFIVLV